MARPRTLRARLALVFGLTAIVVAAGFGTALLHQARRQLAIAIDEGLVPLATELAIRVGQEGPAVIAGPVPELQPPSDAVAQVLDDDGRLLSTSHLPGDDRPLIGSADAASVAATGQRRHGPLTIGTADGTEARFLAYRTTAGGRSSS